MGRGIWVVNYDVKVGFYAVEVLDNLVYNLDEPAGRGIATLGHDEPFEEQGGGAKGGEGYRVLIDGYLVEQRHEVEQGKYSSFGQSREPRQRGEWVAGQGS